MIKMATKSFLKNITLKNKKSAESFLNALENAENKKAKKVVLNERVEEVKDGAIIKRMFCKEK